MDITKTEFDGLLIIQPSVFKDERGCFYEMYNLERFKNFGLNFEFVQDNISRSVKNTIRGLHYQVGNNAQGKLCKVLSGKVLEIAVDIRFNSPTFGKYFEMILSEENPVQIYIPAGFAHGFSVLSDEAVFHYKTTKYYSKVDERSILFNDPDLNIDWKVENPVVSEKDLKAKLFKNIDKDFVF
jgi:dTDP-4-dehydrorhamnose 3,5-epimerase